LACISVRVRPPDHGKFVTLAPRKGGLKTFIRSGIALGWLKARQLETDEGAWTVNQPFAA
jgi:hypothetical protein